MRQQLDREQTAFFETRVAGRTEVWLAIQAAVAEMRVSGDGADGVASAQAILDAAGVTLPTGDLADGAYDALGAFYAVPQWVVSDPEDVGVDGKDADEGDEDGDEDDEEEEAERRREEKGKAVVGEREGVKVKARLSERGGRDVVVVLGRGESVRVLARRVGVDCQVCVPAISHFVSFWGFSTTRMCD